MHQEEIELEILKSLGKVTSQRTIADEIGYSAGKVNYVLKKLVEKGLVKVDRFVNSKSKVQYKYLLTPEGIKEKIAIAEKFIQIKKEEYDKLQFIEYMKGVFIFQGLGNIPNNPLLDDLIELYNTIYAPYGHMIMTIPINNVVEEKP